MALCSYCLKRNDFPTINVDVKCYDAGKIEWHHLGNICSECKKYLKGIWRYHREVKC